MFSSSESLFLCLDLREATELAAGACHHAGNYFPGERRVALQQWLGKKRIHLVLWDVWYDEVLLNGETYFT